MGLKSRLAEVAIGAPVPVFALVGAGGREAVDVLRLDRTVRLVSSPRPANILLVAGRISADLLGPAVAIHDMMSHPRATVWWPLGAPAGRLARLFGEVTILDSSDTASQIVRIHEELLRGERPSERAVRPDVDPAPWRDVGPYGQGGKGMTGGTPYGRRMAERAPDRDGLELDVLHVEIGPFFSAFPPGLRLTITLQGDVLQKATLERNPFRHVGPGSCDVLFRRALREPVSIATLEIERARHHVRWLAYMLRVHGLGSLSQRTSALATELSPHSLEEVLRLGRLLKRTYALSWATAGVGLLPGDVAKSAGGPVSRAAGYSRDARAEDSAYVALGFEPLTHPQGDARARWWQRIAESTQALELAGRAGDQRTTTGDRVESPHGELSGRGDSARTLLGALPSLLEGMEWGDAVTTIVSLDLDLEALI